MFFGYETIPPATGLQLPVPVKGSGKLFCICNALLYYPERKSLMIPAFQFVSNYSRLAACLNC